MCFEYTGSVCILKFVCLSVSVFVKEWWWERKEIEFSVSAETKC